MTTKKPDLYKAPEDGVVLKYELYNVPLQKQVGHVRHWGIQVYRNGLDGWHRMMESSATSRKTITGSMPFLHSIGEPRALAVGLAGVVGLLLSRKRGMIHRIIYPITAIGVTGAAMWTTYPHNRKTLTNHCYKLWNYLTKH